MKKSVSLLVGVASVFLGFLGTARSEAVVGQAAPPFSLAGIDGENHSLASYAGKYVVLEWTNPDCPFVHKQYDSGTMQRLQMQSESKGVIWLSICSSGPGKQGNYSPDETKKILADRKATPTAYLIDATGEVGKSYGAKTTPDMYVVNPKGVIIYEGAIDSIRSSDPRDIPKSTNYVEKALDEAMSGKPVSDPSTVSYGCGVHY